MPVGTILQYVLIKWLIALDVLVSVALYLGVVVGFSYSVALFKRNSFKFSTIRGFQLEKVQTRLL